MSTSCCFSSSHRSHPFHWKHSFLTLIGEAGHRWATTSYYHHYPHLENALPNILVGNTIGHSTVELDIRIAMVAAFSLAALPGLFASTIAAKPVVEQNSLEKLSLTRRSSLAATYNPPKHDQKRAEALNGGTTSVVNKPLQDRDNGINTPAEDQATFYSASSIGIGCPPIRVVSD